MFPMATSPKTDEQRYTSLLEQKISDRHIKKTTDRNHSTEGSSASSPGLPAGARGQTMPKAEYPDPNPDTPRVQEPVAPRWRLKPGCSRRSSGEQDVHSSSISNDEAIHIILIIRMCFLQCYTICFKVIYG